MTTDDDEAEAKLVRLTANLSRVEALSARLVKAMVEKKAHDRALDGPGQDIYVKAAAAYLAEMMQNPARVMAHQIGYWGKTLTHYVAAQRALAAGMPGVPADEGPADKRFANPIWDTNPAFNFIKQQYLLNAEAVTAAVSDMESLEEADRRRVAFFARQIVDMFAPTNFLGTNPDALERAVATDGMSLVQGLENLVRDIEAHQGEMQVTLADPQAFAVGVNLATTPGSVVFRNRLFELIQYKATTPTVHQVPLLIFPPWINKFYVLDMKPANSLIKWMVDQGFTVFVVSWVNPDATYAEVGMDDYVRDGFLTAMAEVRRQTGQAQINAVGYCIAGTTLGLTLAHLHKAGDRSVKSATFLTALTDFSDPGEVGVFLSNDFVDGIARQAKADGILSKAFMARTFSFLRSNDLIYLPAIKSYMLGEAPPAFDLLYWNGDGTNLPATMALEYLRGLCQMDGFAKGEFEVFGRKVRLADVTVPLCAVACQTDHIAPWKASFNGIRQMGAADKTFILSQSGHVAGIVNPPAKDRYGHYTHQGPMTDPDTWLQGASFTAASWWPRWRDWLAERSGSQIAAPQIAAEELCPAPGTYVGAAA